MAQVCPVVGTTNTVLPPSHPDIDLSKPGQKCPVVGATTDHHPGSLLHQHPPVPAGTDTTSSIAKAAACPVLQKTVHEPQAQALDDDLCPVVGTATTVLPPGHPSTEGASDDAACPVTKARVGHHRGHVTVHPDLSKAADGAVCPVSGKKKA